MFMTYGLHTPHLHEKPDLSNLKSIQWGREKEEQARKDYECATGSSVICCGIFISKKNPLFASSPDGLVNETLLEIKCPYSLKDINLTDPAASKNVKCSFLDRNLNLRRSHLYFYQIQLGMYVTGCRKTHFVTWTTKSCLIEEIAYDQTFTGWQIERAFKAFKSHVAVEYFEHRVPRKLPPFVL